MDQVLGGTTAFGERRLPSPLEGLRRAGCRLPPTRLTRIATSAIRRLCLAGRDDPIDVAPFEGQAARLYPRDNLSEKRVFAAVQFWDAVERREIARAIAASPVDRPFCFVDAGANVGLYTLFARAAAMSAGRPFRALAIEPDAENRRRLTFNLAASDASDVEVSTMALSDTFGEARLEAHRDNRGQVTLGETGQLVGTAPLANVLADAGLHAPDALKIDIEGMETRVLGAYFQNTPTEQRPRLIVMEALKGGEDTALELCLSEGYQVTARAKMNVVLGLHDAVGDQDAG